MPDAPAWRQKALMLRETARRHEITRDALLTLADDCEEIAQEMDRQSGHPGAGPEFRWARQKKGKP